MDLSIIIPALNEAYKIGGDIAAAAAFLKENGFQGEVIVVDDGSTDGTEAAAKLVAVSPPVEKTVLRLEKNSGKGAAVRTGVLKSRGEVVLYADSGSCIPYANALPVIKRIRAGGLHIGLASRRLEETVIQRGQPLRRRLISRLFHWAAVHVAGLPRWVTDSQCGFKVYEGKHACELFAGLGTPGFLFELEIIIKAVRAGLKVEEFPVEWTCDLDTRLKPAAQARGIFRELLHVRRLARRG
jgi:dolichyl-phosphate beta-glucosyltransferase